MLSNTRIFRNEDNLYIEGLIESVDKQNIVFLSTVFLRKKDLLYTMKQDKKLVFTMVSMEESPLFKGWKRYVLNLKEVQYIDYKTSGIKCVEQQDPQAKDLGTIYNLMDGLEYVEARDHLGTEELKRLILPLGVLDTRYILDPDSGIEVEVKMFGAKSPYEFLFENVSKTGMLLSSSYSFVPFDKSTLVTVKVCFKNSKCDLPDIIVTGKVAKILDQDVAGGELRKFVGINLTKSSDVKSWGKFLKYLKTTSENS